MEYSSPDHSTGAIRPPSTMGCRANMGSIAPYSNPTDGRDDDAGSRQSQSSRVKRIQLRSRGTSDCA